jgi:hypothetical protein
LNHAVRVLFHAMSGFVTTAAIARGRLEPDPSRFFTVRSGSSQISSLSCPARRLRSTVLLSWDTACLGVVGERGKGWPIMTTIIDRYRFRVRVHRGYGSFHFPFGLAGFWARIP